MTRLWTPGPWVVDKRNPSWVRAESDEDLVASCYRLKGGHKRSPDEQMANARLIAEAPEMAKLLDTLVRLDDGPHTDDALDQQDRLWTEITALLKRLEGGA